jgi:hypothetical protein
MGGVNLYTFGLNNGLYNIDKFGLIAIALPIATAGLAVAIAAIFGMTIIECMNDPVCSEAVRSELQRLVIGLVGPALAAHAAQCQFFYSKYEDLKGKCKSCKTTKSRGANIVEQCKRCIKGSSEFACFSAYVAARGLYLLNGCDFLVHPGFTERWGGHKQAYIEAAKGMEHCSEQVLNNCIAPGL